MYGIQPYCDICGIHIAPSKYLRFNSKSECAEWVKNQSILELAGFGKGWFLCSHCNTKANRAKMRAAKRDCFR